jgi:glutamyl-tRNA synthetase
MERHEKGYYRDCAFELIKHGRAYYSVSKKSEPKIEIFRTDVYPKAFESEDTLITIKFIVPEGTTEFDDMLKGTVTFDNRTIDDFIIIKSNGVPVYNFAVVIDDAMMRISHVIRGEDHISNTPKQILLYQALGWDIPAFMHLPLILGIDRTPLSKRHGGTSVEYFRKEGFLPSGLMNYLALLGWSIDEEVFEPLSSIDTFTLDKINNKSVVFDYKKLGWINGKHLHSLEFEAFYHAFWQWITFVDPDETRECALVRKHPESVFKTLLKNCQEKTGTFSSLFYLIKPLLDTAESIEYEKEWLVKYHNKPDASPLLEQAIQLFSEKPLGTFEEIKAVFDTLIQSCDQKPGFVYQVLRGALTGTLVSPGIIETIDFLGREETIKRLGIALLKPIVLN